VTGNRGRPAGVAAPKGRAPEVPASPREGATRAPIHGSGSAVRQHRLIRINGYGLCRVHHLQNSAPSGGQD